MALTILHDRDQWEGVRARLDGPAALAAFDYVSAAATLYDGDGGGPGSCRAEAAVWETPDGIVFHPYVRRSIPNAHGLTDLVSAYEFGGVWCGGGGTAGHYDRLRRDFAHAFAAYAAAAGIVSAFIRLHPFLPVGGLAEGGYEVRMQQEHVVVPLGRPHDAIRADYTQACRNQVRQGTRRGLSLRRDRDVDTFYRLSQVNLKRLSASSFYLFPPSYYAAVAGCTEMFQAVGPDGRVAGAHLYVRDGAYMFAFLCYAAEDALALRPNDFLYDAAIGWAAGQGIEVFHMGGGAPSLMHFKRGFSRHLHPYYQARRVFLPEIYADLAGEAASGRFFPAYRRPFPVLARETAS